MLTRGNNDNLVLICSFHCRGQFFFLFLNNRLMLIISFLRFEDGIHGIYFGTVINKNC